MPVCSLVQVMLTCCPSSRVGYWSDGASQANSPLGPSTTPSRACSRRLARSVGRGDVADDLGELGGLRPHRPMAGRQVDPGDVAQLGDPCEEWPLGVLARVALVLLGAEAGADHRRGDVVARIVGELGSLANQRARHRHGAITEPLHLLLAEPIEVLLGLDLLPDHRLLDASEVGIERALARGSVDVDDRRDVIGAPVAGGVAAEAGRAVEDEHDRRVRGAHGIADGIHMVGERDLGPVGIGRFETGQGQRGDIVSLAPQDGGDLVPRPGTQPEAGYQDDRRARHGLSPSVRWTCGVHRSRVGAEDDIRCHEPALPSCPTNHNRSSQMQADDVRSLFAYDRWATSRVLDALAGVSAEDWSRTGSVGDRGLGEILVHHLAASQRWRVGFETRGERDLPRAEDEPLPTIDELRRRWDEEWLAVDAWLRTLTDEFVAYRYDGVPVWQMLVHVVNHG